MGRGVLVSLAWAFVATSGALAGTSSRAECTAACGITIAQCATTCSAFANLNAACRRAVLKRCQREGVAVCAPPTSTVTTTLAPSSTTAHPTTTTHGQTTSTTLPTGSSCATPRPLAVGTTASGDTGGGNDHGPGVGCMQNAEAPDLIYVVVPDTDGTLVLSLTSEWDGGLYVRTACDEPSSEIVCIDSLGENATEVLQVAVTAGTPLYVYVDGYTTESSGYYELTSALE
jgi:hypothetical protein